MVSILPRTHHMAELFSHLSSLRVLLSLSIKTTQGVCQYLLYGNPINGYFSLTPKILFTNPCLKVAEGVTCVTVHSGLVKNLSLFLTSTHEFEFSLVNF